MNEYVEKGATKTLCACTGVDMQAFLLFMGGGGGGCSNH